MHLDAIFTSKLPEIIKLNKPNDYKTKVNEFIKYEQFKPI